VRGHLIFGLPQCGIPVQPVFRGGALLRKVAVDFLWKKGWDSAPGQPPPEVETVGGAGRGEEFLLQRPSLLIAQPSEQLRASAGKAAYDFGAAEAALVDFLRPQGGGGLLDALHFAAGKCDGDKNHARHCSE